MTRPRHEITTRKVLLQLPGMAEVTSRLAEFAGADGQPLPLQVYYPAGVAPPVAAVVIVEGYADPGFTKVFGCRFMEMDWSVSMARLIAASGLAVITYANREPEADAKALLAHVIAHADVLMRALASNVPLTLVNHPEAPHSFDLCHDSELTRHVLRQALAFLHFHLA